MEITSVYWTLIGEFAAVLIGVLIAVIVVILKDRKKLKEYSDYLKEVIKKLKKKLQEDTVFPGKYLYKFIVPGTDDKVIEVERLFDHTGAVIEKTASRTGKYISVSILVSMKNASAVIGKYKEAEKIEGIISL